MKKIKTLFLLLLAVAFASCGEVRLTVASTKNVEFSNEYKLLKSNAKAKSMDFTTAIDRCIESVDGGMYLKNVIIRQGFTKWKVKADVWGIPPTTPTK